VSGPHPARADERLAGLVRLAQVLAESRSLPELAERACEEARFAFGARSVSLSRLEPEHGVLRTLVNVGDLAPGELRFPAEETYQIAEFPLLATMVDEARPWRLQVDDEDGARPERSLLQAMGAASAVAAPVLAQGRVWGELFATRSAQDDLFDEADVLFAQAFAGMVSAGLAQVEHLLLVERLAYHDALTGLGNRRLVEDELDRALESRRTGGGPVTVVMADVNRLKQANDQHGHDAGDRALVSIAHALSAACGPVPGAVAGRIGGDEFCAVLPGYPIAVGEALASAFLRGTTSAPYGVSVACGIASTQGIEGPVTPQRLFALADGAQYEAKRTGATHPVLADPAKLATERRRNRPQIGRGEERSVLAVALDAVAGTPARSDGSPQDRLAAGLSAVADRSGAIGWVLDRLSLGAALPEMHNVPAGKVFLASVPAPPGAAWVIRARATGTVVRADDQDVPLAAIRGCEVVVVAAADGWMAELVCGVVPPPTDAAAVLLAVLAVALSG
jgi:diguanylate cyclase (GGDEF)-like protein